MSRIALLTLLAASLAAPSLPCVAGDEEKREERRIVIRRGGPHVIFGSGRGYLGTRLVEMTPELRAYFGAPEDAGVLVSKVIADSPAAAADLRVGDVITAIDGEPVDSPRDVRAGIRPHEAGERVTLEVWRERARLELAPELDERSAHDLGSHLRWIPGPAGGLPHLEIEGVDIDVDFARDISRSLRDIDWDSIARRLPHRKLQERMHQLERRLRELETKLEAAESER